MGYGMMCATTLKIRVAQGGANDVKSGALPPPPPTGAVGGGGAQHLHREVVAQDTPPSVPSPVLSTPSGTQWVQVGAKCGRQCGPNAVTMRARCGRGAGSSFLSPQKSWGG